MTDGVLLAAIRSHAAELAAADQPDGIGGDRYAAAMVRSEIRYAKAGRVRVSLSRWLGHEPSSAERMALSRALARLEAAGELQRTYGRTLTRCTHVTLTKPKRKAR